jgi:hypothetical protein
MAFPDLAATSQMLAHGQSRMYGNGRFWAAKRTSKITASGLPLLAEVQARVVSIHNVGDVYDMLTLFPNVVCIPECKPSGGIELTGNDPSRPALDRGHRDGSFNASPHVRSPECDE